MHRFGLMYEIKKENKFIIPEHLSSDMPYENWKYNNNEDILEIYYKFDKYMPNGIMSVLIVNLYE